MDCSYEEQGLQEHSTDLSPTTTTTTVLLPPPQHEAPTRPPPTTTTLYNTVGGGYTHHHHYYYCTTTTTPTPPIAIADFSPTWDHTVGGTKVLICLAEPLPAVSNEEPIRCTVTPSPSSSSSGGGSSSLVVVVNPMVLRCNMPPHPPGEVFLRIEKGDGTPLTEYTKQSFR